MFITIEKTKEIDSWLRKNEEKDSQFKENYLSLLTVERKMFENIRNNLGKVWASEHINKK